MTDIREPSADSTPEKAPAPKRRKMLIALGTGAVLLTGGVFGAQAIAQSKTFQHVQQAAFDGDWGGPWGGGWRQHHRRQMGPMTEAQIEKRVTRMVRHMAIEVDATTEQEAKIVKIATAAAKQILPIRKEMRDTRQQLRDLLTANTIDRQALEKLREARLADADRMSKTLVNAIADVAEVLTPQQRIQLEEMMGRRHGRRHGPGFGGPGFGGGPDGGPMPGPDGGPGPQRG